MTKGDNINLYNVLNDRRLGQLAGAKFAYAVSKNISLLKPEVEALKTALKPSEEFEKYDAERIKLAEEHAKKDEKGKALTTKNSQGAEEFVIEDTEAWEKAFTALREEHKSALEAREEQIKDQNELLKTESTLVLHKVALADVPNQITTEQMRGIEAIVEDGVLSPFPVK